MFDLAERPLVWIPVKWPVLKPTGKAGLAKEHTAHIEIEIELLDRDDLIDLFDHRFSESDDVEQDESVEDEQDEKVARIASRDREVARFKRVVKQWRLVADAGKALELNDENIRRMLGVPGFVTAFEAAYLTACAGKAEVRRGN